MNKVPKICWLLCLTLLAVSQLTHSASPEAGAQGEKKIGSSTSIFIGLRPWFTSWEVPLTDAQVVIPDPLAPVPVLKLFPVHAPAGSAVVPMTVFGLRHNDLTISTNVLPRTKYSTGGLATSDTTRQELDFNLGYSLTPNLLATLVYKTAKIEGLVTSNAQATLGARDGAKIRSVLLGLGASVPMQGPLSLYGNVAYGLGRQRSEVPDAAGKSKANAAYTIGEVGFAYRLYEQSSALKNATLQLGYRAQSYRAKDVTFGSYSIPGGTLIATEQRDVDTFTGGFVLGIVGVF